MAFSFRKIISNISYFKKPGDDDKHGTKNNGTKKEDLFPSNVHLEPFECNVLEPDSTSKQLAGSLKLPDSVRNFAAKAGSLSDTDLLATGIDTKKSRRKSRKLKIDINKATQSNSDHLNTSEENEEFDLENTPKHVLLQSKSSEVFTERLKAFDLKKSFDLFDDISDHMSSTFDEENIDIESLSDNSETDASTSSNTDGKEVKMCRKVEPDDLDNRHLPSATPESFGDVELDTNEDNRVSVLLNYQIQLEKIETFLKQLFSDFRFHIEVSKVFNSKTITDTDDTDITNIISQMSHSMLQRASRNENASPSESWNIISDREDKLMKTKVKQQLLTLKEMIETFLNLYLAADKKNNMNHCNKPTKSRSKKKTLRQNRITLKLKNKKKKIRHCDFPDLGDAFNNLFSREQDCNKTALIETDSVETSQCNCQCHCQSQSDSGLSNKTDQTISNQSISSSIGNFTLDSTTLSAFSESLDLIISYNSFDDSSLYCTLLKKPAIERITFYIKVHSIEITSKASDEEFESKNVILFHCPPCKVTENEENGVLKHILSQSHCEKIHFLYKTAYIKKCVAAGVEIQPSTVLNPMTMYRDENKIVCFGEAKYACSLCFENLIVGESLLMNHCSDPDHVDRRERLQDIFE